MNSNHPKRMKQQDTVTAKKTPTIVNGASSLSFLGSMYADFLTKRCVKVLTVILYIAVWYISIWETLKVNDGLDLTDIVPQNTNEYAFLNAQGKYFGFYNMYAVTQGEFEYPTNQRLLYEYHDAFMRVQSIIKNDDGGLPEFWLGLFRDWLIGKFIFAANMYIFFNV